MEIIPGASLLGFGFDSLGNFDTTSAKQSILVPAAGKSGTYTDPFSKREYEIPLDVAVVRGGGDHTQNASVSVAKNQLEFQSSISLEVGISGSYRGFSGEFKSAFENEVKSQNSYWYCVAAGRFDSWSVLLQKTNLSPTFKEDPDVAEMLTQTSFTPDNRHIFFRVFQKWGTHIIDQATVGARFRYHCAIISKYSSDRSMLGSKLGLEFKTLFISTAAQASADWKKLTQEWSDSRTTSWSASGGDTSMLEISPSPSYGDSFSGAFQKWVRSASAIPAVTYFRLLELSKLFSGDLAQAVADAVKTYTNQGIYCESDANYTPTKATFGGYIIRSGETIPNHAVPPPANTWGTGTQLVVFDGVTLRPLVNVGSYLKKDTKDCTQEVNQWLWNPLLGAVSGLTHKSYLVVLTLFGLRSCLFPKTEFATWLGACGAGLSAWRKLLSEEDGDGYLVSSIVIGQQGLRPQQAIEKFSILPVRQNVFYNATASLIPSSGGGPYTLLTPTTTAAREDLTPSDAKISPTQCYYDVGWRQYWDVGEVICVGGRARRCVVDGKWEDEGSC